MKKSLLFFVIKAVVLLIMDAAMMLLTMLVSTLLGVVAGDWIASGGSAGVAFTAITSLCGWLGLLLYTALTVRKLRRAEVADTPVRFALKETAVFFVFLLPLSVIGCVSDVPLFEGIAGYVYAPYLSLTALGVSPLLSVLCYVLLYFLLVFCVRTLTEKKNHIKALPGQSPEEPTEKE